MLASHVVGCCMHRWDVVVIVELFLYITGCCRCCGRKDDDVTFTYCFLFNKLLSLWLLKSFRGPIVNRRRSPDQRRVIFWVLLYLLLLLQLSLPQPLSWLFGSIRPITGGTVHCVYCVEKGGGLRASWLRVPIVRHGISLHGAVVGARRWCGRRYPLRQALCDDDVCVAHFYAAVPFTRCLAMLLAAGKSTTTTVDSGAAAAAGDDAFTAADAPVALALAAATWLWLLPVPRPLRPLRGSRGGRDSEDFAPLLLAVAALLLLFVAFALPDADAADVWLPFAILPPDSGAEDCSLPLWLTFSPAATVLAVPLAGKWLNFFRWY